MVFYKTLAVEHLDFQLHETLLNPMTCERLSMQEDIHTQTYYTLACFCVHVHMRTI